jgi:hypothetical protein
MRCLEVAVNGERFCVAGADHIPMLGASVKHGGLDDDADRDKTSLTIHGLSGDATTDYYWGAETLALTSGDVVTIRIVDEAAADTPVPFPTSPALIKLREQDRAIKRVLAASREWRAGLDLSALEAQGRRANFKLLFWGALTVLGLAVWFFWS